MTRLSALPFLGLLLMGCVSQLTPSTFHVPAHELSLGDVQRALAEQGMTADRVDAQSGIIETPWEDTGRNSDGTVWAARYLITVGTHAGESRVTVAMDLRTCESAPSSGRINADSCPRLPDGTTPEMYQGRLDDFADRLRAALGGVPVAR